MPISWEKRCPAVSSTGDRPLLTSVVDEARTEVCAPKLGGRRYSSTRGQQEAAKDNKLQVPILGRPIWGAQGLRPKGGGKNPNVEFELTEE